MSQNFLLKSKEGWREAIDRERLISVVSLVSSYAAAVLQSVNIPLTEGKTISIGSSYCQLSFCQWIYR